MPGLVGDYFGRANAGSIVGWVFALAGSLAAVGPFVAGAIYDATGSYRTAFVLSGLANLLSLGFVALLREPRRAAAAAPAPVTAPGDAEAESPQGLRPRSSLALAPPSPPRASGVRSARTCGTPSAPPDTTAG
jgi:MFS family permease